MIDRLNLNSSFMLSSYILSLENTYSTFKEQADVKFECTRKKVIKCTGWAKKSGFLGIYCSKNDPTG